jgi:hypothetical protein
LRCLDRLVAGSALSVILRASLVWLVFLLIAVTGGALREALISPMLGEHRAHQIGTLLVCLLLAGVIILFIRRLRPTPRMALAIGAGWAGMTVVFEFTVFHFIVGRPLSELLAAYDLSAGRLWPLVLFTELLTPWLAAMRLAQPGHARPATPPRPRSKPVVRLPEQYQRTIAKEEIASLPLRRYDGEVRVVNTADALAEAMLDIRQERVVGFDTETRPAFQKGERYLPSLVQVATARRVYLLQLQQLDCAREVAELLANPRIVKAGVAVAGDVGQLKHLFPLSAAAVIDIGQIAKRHGNKQSGLRNLAALFLGWRMAKGARTTNWSAPSLTQAQIGYAATDAWASRELYLRFEELGLT